MTQTDLKTISCLILTGMVVQTAAMLGVAKLRGSATAYAYQSPDAREYVSLARGLARQGRYVCVDSEGNQSGGPDTWRTPGYPAVLALIITIFGDSVWVLLLFNQLLNMMTIPLLWLLIRQYTSYRWAMVAAMAWILDPFRIYYGLWLMAETLFVVVLLIGLLAWSQWTAKGWNIRRAAILGVLAGAAVMVRPIAFALPLLAVVGIGFAGRGKQKMLVWPVACLLGCLIVIGPWMLRNRMVAGHWGISHQSGASFAYHKVADVVLWSQGRSRYRFDPDVHDEIRGEIDRRLQKKWAQRFGPLSEIERQNLSWRKLNYNLATDIDQFSASSLLWSAGTQMLANRRWAAVECFSAQGINMLIFPLGLLLFPPAGTGTAPLSMLAGGSGSWLSTTLAAGIGICYTVLALAVLGRLIHAFLGRYWPASFFVFWPAAALFVLALPFEDPRFRLPLVPLMWLIALTQREAEPLCDSTAVSQGDIIDLPTLPSV
ncbi:MAG: glycosyltransferase family 39 protein [Planctomycetota bacterium]|nr:MAG: glycosyltransferase family 39 protein [Planctomycetota bacterium]